jgi:hypothetical protein
MNRSSVRRFLPYRIDLNQIWKVSTGSRSYRSNLLYMFRGFVFGCCQCTDYIASDGRTIDEWIGNDLEGNGHGLMRVYPGIYLEGMKGDVTPPPPVMIANVRPRVEPNASRTQVYISSLGAPVEVAYIYICIQDEAVPVTGRGGP